MCNAYSLRRSRDELIQIARAMQPKLPLPILGLPPDWTPRYRIGPRQYGLILRLSESGEGIHWSLASWGLIPPHAKTLPKQVLTNARDDKLTSWPWKLVVRRGRCLVLADGFYEPEKPARSSERVPWSYYRRPDDAAFAMAGLWSEAADPRTGEVIDTYTVVTTDASPAIRVHDRMPVMLRDADHAAWLTPDGVPTELLRPWPADDLEGWRVGDEARHPRAPDHPGLIRPVEPPAAQQTQLEL